MNQKNYNRMIIFILTILIVITLIVSKKISDTRVEHLKNEYYLNYSKSIKKEIDLLVQSKKDSTLSLALALSRNNKAIVEALLSNRIESLELKNFSKSLKENTKYKNVWFQIIDQKGTSIYRSWVDKRGEDLTKIRADVREMIVDPRVLSTISVGLFDMTFKSMVPIYKDKKFIGILEVITHFNSIAKKLSKNGTKTVVLADKKYKDQMIYPFTNRFVGDYYAANLDASSKHLSYMENKGIDSFIKLKKSYTIDNELNTVNVVYTIKDINGMDMGYIILFKDIDSFVQNEFEAIKMNVLFYMIIILLSISIAGYLISQRRYRTLTKITLDEERKNNLKISYILNAQPYIITIRDNTSLREVNSAFFKLFNKYDSLESFTKEHDCICDFFIDPKNNDDSYLLKDKGWLDKVLKTPDNRYKVAIKQNDEVRHFMVNAKKADEKQIGETLILITYIDITDLKDKENMIFEQSKMVSMGEMIMNIAHHWRQPLSVISTAASGMKVKKEYGMLEDEEFYSNCDAIDENAQYLSKTIEDFKKFIVNDHEKVDFLFDDIISEVFELVDASVKSNNIKIVTDLQEGIKLYGNTTDLMQCIINIYNNANDALLNIDKEKRFIFLDLKQYDNEVKLIIKDNAGGIPEDILPKIFEPYFTTKHQSQGTGMGLSAVYSTIRSMDGTITAKNNKFIYESEEFTGAEFIITFSI
ncbi:MAG: ATP-binding protein [Campylobacterota bacterium]|nr:ATP-binding protein [Campylobacterota bacterium]